jgi:hypothetical protein
MKTITLNLTETNYNSVLNLSKLLNYNNTEIVNNAINLYTYIQKCLNNGQKILIEDKDGNTYTLEFRKRLL